MLAKNFADQLAQQVKKNGLVDFGQPLQYGKVSFQPKVLQKKGFKTLKEAIVITQKLLCLWQLTRFPSRPVLAQNVANTQVLSYLNE